MCFRKNKKPKEEKTKERVRKEKKAKEKTRREKKPKEKVRKEKKRTVKENVVYPPMERDIATVEMTTMQINMPAGLTVSMGSDLGTRDYQQDSMAYSTVRNQFAAVVCDGMGGLKGSEQASGTAVALWKARYEAGFSSFVNFAEETICAMDRAIAEKEQAGGTTVAAIWIHDGGLQWMSVGDSKVYLIRREKLYPLTREHNYQLVLNGRLQRGEISPERYEKEMQKGGSLVSYLGCGQFPFTDIRREPEKLLPGDIVLVCSDGLYKSIPEQQLGRMISTYLGDFDTLAPYLLNYAAMHNRVRDNTTLVAVRYEGP